MELIIVISLIIVIILFLEYRITALSNKLNKLSGYIDAALFKQNVLNISHIEFAQSVKDKLSDLIDEHNKMVQK